MAKNEGARLREDADRPSPKTALRRHSQGLAVVACGGGDQVPIDRLVHADVAAVEQVQEKDTKVRSADGA